MEPQATKRIRKIQYGVIQEMPSCVVALGTRHNFNTPKGGKVEYFVSEITENKDAFFETGAVEYNIYISKDKTRNEQIFWKRYSLRPDLIEFIFDEEEEFEV